METQSYKSALSRILAKDAQRLAHNLRYCIYKQCLMKRINFNLALNLPKIPSSERQVDARVIR